MWNEEAGAETVTIHPWAGVSQPQVWQGMGRNGPSTNAPNFASNGGAIRGGNQQQRSWDHQQQAQMPPPGSTAWQPQLAWAPMAPPQPANPWHLSQQQWAPSSSPNSTYADQAKKSMSRGGAPSVSGGVPSRFDGVANWGGGSVKVDQQTPWDTTAAGGGGMQPPHANRDWNAAAVTVAGGGCPATGVNNGSGRWGQPAPVVGMPPGVSNAVWPNGMVGNTSNAITGVGVGAAGNNNAEWSQNAAAVAVAAAAAAAAAGGAPTVVPPALVGQVPPHHHRMPQQQPYGGGHWTGAGGVPPSIMTPGGAHGGAVVPPGATGGASAPGGNWCQPSMGGGAPNADPARIAAYDPNPQTPGPWVAPQGEMNNDMMWRDPNPKQKKVQRDTGTALWGDPSSQRGEIRRWKDADESTIPNVQAPPSGTDWSQHSLNVTSAPTMVSNNNKSFMSGGGGMMGMNNGGGASTNDSLGGANASAVSSGWGDPAPPPNLLPNVDIGTSCWGGSGGGSSATTNAGSSGVGGGNGGPPVIGSVPTSLWPPSSGAVGGGDVSNGGDALKVDDVDSMRSYHIQNNSEYDDIDAYAKFVKANKPLAAALGTLTARLNAAQRDLSKLYHHRQAGAGRTSALDKNEEERLISQIKNARSEFSEMKRGICDALLTLNTGGAQSGASGGTSTHNGSLPSDGVQSSRLQQWKKSNSTATTASNGNTNNSQDSEIVQSLINASQNLSLQDVNNVDDRSGGDWKSGALDWSPPGSIGNGSVGGGFEKADANNMNGGSNPNSYTSGGGFPNARGNETDEFTAATIVDDGPPEFVPGKKWEWRDPNKVAEDPNATPGTCKPNPLLSSAALQHPLVGNAMPTGVLSSSSSTSLAGSDPSKTWGYPSSTVVSSSSEIWNSKRLPAMDAPPPPVGRMMNGPPPPNVGSGFNANRMQQQQQQQQFQSGYWILFQLINTNEQQIQMICNRIGRLINFMVIGHKIACAKFVETNIEGLLQRLKADGMLSMQQVKVVPDEEIEKVVRSSRANNMPVTSVWRGGSGGEWSNDLVSSMNLPPPQLSQQQQPQQHFGGDFGGNGGF